jgi:hypothetical protein
MTNSQRTIKYSTYTLTACCGIQASRTGEYLFLEVPLFLKLQLARSWLQETASQPLEVQPQAGQPVCNQTKIAHSDQPALLDNPFLWFLIGGARDPTTALSGQASKQVQVVSALTSRKPSKREAKQVKKVLAEPHSSDPCDLVW